MITFQAHLNLPEEYDLASEFLKKLGDARRVRGAAVTLEDYASNLATPAKETAPAAEDTDADIPAHIARKPAKKAAAKKTPKEEAPTIDAAAIRALMRDFAADKRFGMKGMIDLLREYQCKNGDTAQKISDIQPSDYASLQAKVTAMMGGEAVDPME